MIKVGIDPGHGGKDRANRGPSGYVEADGALDMALACRDELFKQGFDVAMTRTKDDTLSISERTRILNRAKVDLTVSIHSNACADPKVRGVETIHTIHRASLGPKLAEKICGRLVTDLSIPKRRVFSRESETWPGKDYYGIVRETVAPCVIVEVEFHSNPEAEQLLKDPDFRKRAGVSIAKSIMVFAGEWF